MMLRTKRTDSGSIFSFRRMLFRYKYAARYLNSGTVLDIGCGYGYGSDLLSDYEYVGIDCDSEAIKVALESNAKSRFICMTAPPLDFPDSSISNIICAEMVEHVESEKVMPLLEECRRVLKDDGILFLSTPNVENRLQPYPGHYKEYTTSEIGHFLHDAGFNIIHKGGLSIDIIKNRYDFDKGFTRWRKALYKKLIGGGLSSGEERECTDHKKNGNLFSGALKSMLRSCLSVCARTVVAIGYYFPDRAEYQVWVCKK